MPVRYADLHKVTGMSIGRQICDALGIKAEQCCSLNIDFSPTEPVRIKAEFWATAEMLYSFSKVLDSEEFVLMRCKDVEDAQS
jgi:hypothetical protein